MSKTATILFIYYPAFLICPGNILPYRENSVNGADGAVNEK
jgi:hypothetical protein